MADGDGGLGLIEVSNPTAPVRLGGFDTSGYASAAQAVGNRIDVADGEWGIQVLRLAPGITQTLAFTLPATLILPHPRVTLSAASSSGLPVTYQVVSGPGVIDGNLLTPAGPGTVVIEANRKPFAPCCG